MRPPILERLASGDVLIADGATGTMLQSAGLPTGMPAEAWILERPEEIMQLHRAYMEAGSQIVLTTTFGGTRARLKAAGLDVQTAEVNRRAAELARITSRLEEARLRLDAETSYGNAAIDEARLRIRQLEELRPLEIESQEALVASLREESRLHFVGRISARGDTIRMARTHLRIAKLLRERGARG